MSLKSRTNFVVDVFWWLDWREHQGFLSFVTFKAVDAHICQFWFVSVPLKSPTESRASIVLNLEVKHHTVEHHLLSNARLLPSVLHRLFHLPLTVGKI